VIRLTNRITGASVEIPDSELASSAAEISQKIRGGLVTPMTARVLIDRILSEEWLKMVQASQLMKVRIEFYVGDPR